jgi:hypothetical protein
VAMYGDYAHLSVRGNIIGTNGDGDGDDMEGNLISGNDYGVTIGGAAAAANRVGGNIIGLDRTGSVAVSKDYGGAGVFEQETQDNVIGTNGDGVSDELERNVISGNKIGGVVIRDNSEHNVVAGNFIGTDISGMKAIGNGIGDGSNGIAIYSGAKNNRIGTDGNGLSDAAERNVISAPLSSEQFPRRSGIVILGVGTDGNVVAGNYIGTDVHGEVALGNGAEGISIAAGAANNRIGTDGDGRYDDHERNVISGNDGTGIWIDADRNIVAGNMIGADCSGHKALPNGGVGVWIGDGQFNRVGTNGDGVADDAEGNVISANIYGGVTISGADASGNVVAGNLIGTDIAGTVCLGRGGLEIVAGAHSNLIGTDGNGVADEVEGNVIGGGGISIYGKSPDDQGGVYPADNVIAGNFIGTDRSGATPIGNSGAYGVLLWPGVSGTRIGTNGDGLGDAAEGNTIAFNGNAGMLILGDGMSPDPIRNSIRGNSIYSNGGLGIDLSPNLVNDCCGDGVTPNDPGDTDAGPNGLQNYPVLDSRSAWSPGRLIIAGQLDSLPNSQFVLDFYANEFVDPAGYAEGQQFLGSIVIRTGGNGRRQFATTLAITQLVGPYVTATATDSSGNTSEFGPTLTVR